MLDVLLMLLVLAGSTGLGFAIIRRVPPMLHTPLMSMTNAISGVIVLGALLLFAVDGNRFEYALGGIALAAATFNAVGGFAVTDRMVAMFRQKAPADRETQTK